MNYQLSPAGLYIPEQYKAYPTCIDLFCGCGGCSLGMIAAGFQVVMGVDHDVPATMTYLYNLGAYPLDLRFTSYEHRKRFEKALDRQYKSAEKAAKKNGDIFRPFVSGSNFRDWTLDYVKGPTESEKSVSWATWQISEEQWRDRAIEARRQGIPPAVPVPHFYFGDVCELTGEMILDALGIEVGELDCVCGGPPCHGFSTANNKKREVKAHDPRNQLVFEFARLVCEMQPKTMAMENVPEMLNMFTPEGIPVMDVLAKIFEDGNYMEADAFRKAIGITKAKGVIRKPVREKAPEAETRKQMALF